MACDLEVDVNGEETFFVDKEILSSFSGRLSKLFNTSSVSMATNTLKVIFHDLPGGSEAFELIARFCYNNGKTLATPTNTCLLYGAAHFMEMKELIKQTEKSIEGIPHWSWPEVLDALRQCDDFFTAANSSGILDIVLDNVVGRIVTANSNDTSPSGSSPESSGLRSSCDTRSTLSTKNSCHRGWWFEDLLVLNTDIIERAVKCMVSRKLDHVTVSRFLFYYLKCKFSNAKSDDKRKATEIIVDLLYSLDRSCVSCKGLFGVLRVCSSVNISKCCRNRLESIIGSQIDHATLDNLLVATPGTESLYDVNLVLRFLKSFLNSEGQASVTRLKRVGSLMDLYITEVAPDSCLKPSKFVSLITSLPDAARDSHDVVYRAIDMFLEVHTRLSEEEKMKICCTINFQKLSSESCKHLSQNSKFPTKTSIQALLSQQSKLKSLLQETSHYESFAADPDNVNKHDDGEQIILYAKKLDLSVENEKLKAHLQGMQRRVMELEKVCRKMQTRMAKMTKSKFSSTNGSRSLPKLCS